MSLLWCQEKDKTLLEEAHLDYLNLHMRTSHKLYIHIDYKDTWYSHELIWYVSLDFPFAKLFIHKDYKDTWISHELIQFKSSEIPVF